MGQSAVWTRRLPWALGLCVAWVLAYDGGIGKAALQVWQTRWHPRPSTVMMLVDGVCDEAIGEAPS
ncbi:MAG: hypothetical protein AB7U49_09550 [Hyphomicrobiaceae bacterium]